MMIRIIIVEGLRLDAESFNHPFSGFQIRGNNKFHAGDVLVIGTDVFGTGAKQQFSGGQIFNWFYGPGNALADASGSVT